MSNDFIFTFIVRTHAILSHHPQDQLGEVFGENELSQRLAASKQLQRCQVAFGDIGLVNERWDDMSTVEIVVVMWTKHVAYNVAIKDGCLIIIMMGKFRVSSIPTNMLLPALSAFYTT